ncbi:nuclear transport factor 2 family protein [Amylibacter sp.]|nr:nuclear transport factor 2 family protein [Amylibacter sp.]
MDDLLLDKLALHELIDNWAIWRDAGFWEKFRTVWHDDGRMMATWTQGTADEFIEMNKQGWERGVSILHFLGGFTAEIEGNRAITQTKMTISQRGKVHGVMVDVVCTGRFYDFLEKRDGKWGMCLRQPIYEKDRMDPIEPGATVSLDASVLENFPIGYRHLAYLQSQVGYPVKKDMPGLKGPEVDTLYETGQSWLSGAAINWAGHTWG